MMTMSNLTSTSVTTATIATVPLPPTNPNASSSTSSLEKTPSLPNKIYDYIQGKGMSQSYIGTSALPIGQTLLAEFLKKNVTIPSPVAAVSSKNRLVDEIDLTKNDTRRRSRHGTKDTSVERSKSGSREQATVASNNMGNFSSSNGSCSNNNNSSSGGSQQQLSDLKKPLPPPPSFPGGFPPLPVSLPPLPSVAAPATLAHSVMSSSGDATKKSHTAARKSDLPKSSLVVQQHQNQIQPPPHKTQHGQPPLPPAAAPSGPPLPSSTSRSSKSLMSLPMPQTLNDNDDLISYSPTSPITPPPKAAKKGIMDLPLPPGKCEYYKNNYMSSDVLYILVIFFPTTKLLKH